MKASPIIPGTGPLAAATQALIERGLAERDLHGDGPAVAEALAGIEALGLVLLAAGVPCVGADELAAAGLAGLAELAAPSRPGPSRRDRVEAGPSHRASSGRGARRGRAADEEAADERSEDEQPEDGEARVEEAWIEAAARRGRLWLIHSTAAVPRGLAGRPGALALAPAATEAPRKPVAEATLIRLLRGDLDGFRAAEVAREQVRTEAGRRELGWLAGGPLAALGAAVWPAAGATGRSPRKAASSPPAGARASGKRDREAAEHDVAQPTHPPARPLLQLAADGPSAVRDPAQGRTVGAVATGRGKARLVMEAVLFPDGLLALYASEPVLLGLGPRGRRAPRAGRGRPGPRARGQAPGYLEVDGWVPGTPLDVRAGARSLLLAPKKPKKE